MEGSNVLSMTLQTTNQCFRPLSRIWRVLTVEENGENILVKFPSPLEDMEGSNDKLISSGAMLIKFPSPLEDMEGSNGLDERYSSYRLDQFPSPLEDMEGSNRISCIKHQKSPTTSCTS